MKEILDTLVYTDSHEWVEVYEKDIACVGITFHAQDSLGDLVYVELPEVGEFFNKGEEIAVVESVKTAADVYAPVSGEVIEVNEELSQDPALVNNSPYGDGWLFKIKMSSKDELQELMNAEQYKDSLDEE